MAVGLSMATFLLEVGTEELPASFVSEALSQWQARIPSDLSDQFLPPESLEFYGTPRRLAVLLGGLPDRQPDREEDVKGPPAQAAFKQGQPTQAAIGFARSRGATVEDLEVRQTEKGEFVFVQQKTAGRPTGEILAALIPTWILELEGKRFMRWGDGELKFPRPIRWLVALLDDRVLPITLENGSERTLSDRVSQGHRVLHPEAVTIASAADYVGALEAAFVDVDPARRREKIQRQVAEAAASVQGDVVISPVLLAEVTNLVEWPTAVVGSFDSEFLELPAEVAVMEMESHQRYFPVRPSADAAELLPYFITISNGDPARAEVIAEGNGRVIRARLSDGKFFFDADRTQPLEAYVPKLETVTFEERLGSVRDKVGRIQQIAGAIATQLGLNADQQAWVQRAALLCKADLVTLMVGEFPELQGAIGQKYALHSGEPQPVADAIFEHYLPRGADDVLPKSLTGQVVGIADRLDTLVSIFSIGLLPTGSSDPFALRRAANAIVNIIWAASLPLNLQLLLGQIIQEFAASRPDVNATELEQQLTEFFLQRLRSLLQEERQIDYDLVNAVLGEADVEYQARALNDLLDLRDRADFLQAIRDDGRLDHIYETVNRASRLAAQGQLDTDALDPQAQIDPSLFQQSSEQAFYENLQTLLSQTAAARAERDYDQLLSGLTQAAPAVSDFFDGPNSVLVMDDNPEIRQNRLNLLGLLRNHARILADFGAIVKS